MKLARRLAKPLIDLAAYLVVRAALCVVQAMSLESCDAWARRGAWLMWHVVRLRRAVVEENLAIAYPRYDAAEREATALAMWRHLLLMLAEIVHAPRKIHRTNWREHSSFLGMRDLGRRLIDRRPVVLVSAHLGNFEMGGYLLGLHGFPTHSIARPLDNPLLDRWINKFRGATGQYILAKQGSGGEIEQLLNAGGTLALLGDQNAGPGGQWVDFFGKPASTHKAVALFTLVAEAPTAVCAAFRLGAPLHFDMRVADLKDPRDGGRDMKSPRAVAEWYSRCLEELIRRDPSQYWWIHRRWKGDHDRGRRGRRRERAAA